MSEEKITLRQIRESLGLTQQELANLLGMARPYIAAVESGKRPFSERLQGKITNAVSFRDNHGAMAVASPGAKIHNTAAPHPVEDNPPAWAKALEVRLSAEIKSLREQLADIQALLVKLAGK